MVFSDEQRREITELLSENLEQDVRFVYFTQDQPSIELPVQVEVTPCEYCEETEEMLRELTALSDRLSLEVFDFIKDKDKADQYGIIEVPGIAIIGDRDYGIRYYGIPSGYEFSALLDAVMHVSKRHTNLADDTKQALQNLDEPVNMKVFVTPT
ncbi:MAG TPA: thioredoxin family protein [Candidatus Aquicultor sp.]|jgi:glutaredoxin-like protein